MNNTIGGLYAAILTTSSGFTVSSVEGSYTTFGFAENSIIQSVTPTAENTLEVVRRVKPDFTYAVYHNSTPPDSIYKDIYGVVDGKLTLIEIKVGKHTPQHVVPESIEF